MFGYYNPQNYAAAVSNRIDELNKKLVYSLQHVEILEQLLLNNGISIPDADGSESNYNQQIQTQQENFNTLSGLFDNLTNLVRNSSDIKNSADILQLQKDYNKLSTQLDDLSDVVDNLPSGSGGNGGSTSNDYSQQYNDVVSWAEQVPSIQAALTNVITQLDSQSLVDVREVLKVTENADIQLDELDIKLRKLLNPNN